MLILQDSREKIPWNFESYNIEKKVCALNTGDYGIDKCGKLITIERKRSVSELAGNLGKNYKRFRNELDRMKDYRFKYVICEFLYEELLKYPYNIGLPKKVIKKIRMSGKFLASRVSKLTDEYELEFIFCENLFVARDKAVELLIQAYNVYKSENT